ncbi:MAG TPA: phosphatase PAP2 family protein [Xanthobacteraceae bacterium]|nr:phosphatase PAP2 family protein [Xanthobacteraceae bacterium]
MSAPVRLSLPTGAPQPLPVRFIAVLARWLRPRRARARRSGTAIMPRAGQLAVWLPAAAALVVLTMFLVDAHGVAAAHRLPLSVIEVFNDITDYGQSHWFLVPLAAIIMVAAMLVTPATGRLTYLVLTSLVIRLEFIFAAIAVPGLFVTVVKRLIGRVRPSELGAFAYMPWSWRPDYASLPSGHATSAFAAAVAIGAVWPRARIPMWVFAAVIALSRVVITAHFVSDVVAGGVVGAIGALLMRKWFASRGLVFIAEPDGSVRRKPGPSWGLLKSVAARLFSRHQARETA